MHRFLVVRKHDVVEIAIMEHKDGSGYGFVNLTNGHVCRCRFASVKDAIKDMENDSEVLNFYKLPNRVV